MHAHPLISVSMALLAILSSSSPLAGQQSQPSGIYGPELDAFILQALDRYQVPGAAVAVVKDGKPLLVKGYGLRDVTGNQPVDADTIFQLASISKALTTTAAAALIDAGKLTWDQSVAQMLPEFRMMADDMTRELHLRDLLLHRGGFESYTFPPYWQYFFSRREMLHRLRFMRPRYTFRDHPEYSNTGYFVAGELIAAASAKENFEEAMAETLFNPLGMNRSGAWNDLRHHPNTALHYAITQEKPQPVIAETFHPFAAAGGLASSASDLARLMNMLLSHGRFEKRQLLQAETVETLFAPQIACQFDLSAIPPIGPETGYFYSHGWHVYYFGGRRIIEISGALLGVRTNMMLVPQENLGIAVLANLHLTLFPEAVRAKLLAMLSAPKDLPGLQDAIFERGVQIANLVAEKPQAPDNAKPPGHPPSAYAGVYVSDLFGSWTILPSADGKFPFRVETPSPQWTGAMQVWDGNSWTVEWPVLTIRPDLLAFHFEPGRPHPSGFTLDGYEFVRKE